MATPTLNPDSAEAKAAAKAAAKVEADRVKAEAKAEADKIKAEAKAEADRIKAEAKEAKKLRKVEALRNHKCKIKHGPRGKKSSYTEFDLVKGETYEMLQEHIDILNQQANSAVDNTVKII